MAMILTVAMVLSATPLPMTAAAEVGGCTHEHDGECGYREVVPCVHDHDNRCGYAAADAPVATAADAMELIDDVNGSAEAAPCGHDHDEECGYIEAAPCDHVHDTSCGGVSSGDFNDSDIIPGDSDNAVMVAAFDELDEYTLWQGYDYGVIQSQDELDLPGTLTGRSAEGEAITMEGVMWESEPEFDPLVSLDPLEYPGGCYIFSPVLRSGYILAEDVIAPVISVIIRPEGGLGIMPLADQTVDIDGMNGTVITSAIVDAIDTASSTGGGTVTVTGTATNATSGAISLDIPADVTVDWQATLTSSMTTGSLVFLRGMGNFKMTSGSIRNTNITGIALSVTESVQFSMSGGTISATARAVFSTSTTEINVTGGQITATGATGSAIHAVATVIISDNAIISSSGNTVSASSDIYVSDNAQITTSGAAGNYAVRAAQTTYISGGTIKATGSTSSRAVLVNDTLLMTGGTVQASGSATTAIELTSLTSAAAYILDGTVTGNIINTTGTNHVYYTGSRTINGFTGNIHKLDDISFVTPYNGSTLYTYNAATPVESVQARLTNSGRIDLGSATITIKDGATSLSWAAINKTVNTGINTVQSWVDFINTSGMINSGNITVTISGAKSRTGTSFGGTSAIDLPDIVIGPFGVNIDTLSKTVSVGVQSGTLTAGTVGTVTFSVVTEGIANGDYAAIVANLPTGVTVSGQVQVINGAGTLTLAGANSTAAGTTNNLTLTIDGVTSSDFDLTVAAAVSLSALYVNDPGMITPLVSVTSIQSAINSASSPTTVTGSFTGAASTLTLVIPTGKTVVWDAEYSGASNSSSGVNDLIDIQGAGELKIATGGKITDTGNNCAMYIYGSGLNLTVEGEITGTSTAIQMIGTGDSVTVDGGAVSGVGRGIEVNMDNNAVTVTSGTVSSSTGIAVNLNPSDGGYSGTLTVNGGTVESTSFYAICATQNSMVVINDGTVTTASGVDAVIFLDSAALAINGGELSNTNLGFATKIINAAGQSTVYVSGSAINMQSGGIWRDSSYTASGYYTGSNAALFRTNTSNYFTPGQDLFQLDAAPKLTQDTASGVGYSYSGTPHPGNVVASLPSGFTAANVTVNGTTSENYTVNGATVIFSGNYDTGAGALTLVVSGTLAGGRITVPTFTTATFGVNIDKPLANVSATAVGWTYDGGNAHTGFTDLVFTAQSGGTDITAAIGGNYTVAYKVRGANDSTATATVPTNTGDYTATITINADQAYIGSGAVDFTIGKKTLTVTDGTVTAKSYDGATAATVTALTFGGLVSGESLAVVTDYAVGSPSFDSAYAGTNKIVTGTAMLQSTAVANNYTLASGGAYTLADKTISKANQTTPIVGVGNSINKVYGDTDFNMNVTGGESTGAYSYTSSYISVAVVDMSGQVTITSAGSTTLTVKRLGDNNYNDSAEVSTMLTVTKANQTALSIDAIGTKTYGDPPFTLSITGGSGSGMVSYTSSDTSVISISGSTATIHKAGTATITAVKGEDREYNAAVPVMRTITVLPSDSADATLSALTISSGTLTPAFDPSVKSYMASVGNSVDSIMITATANHTGATISGAGRKFLTVGDNTIAITVTAEDDTTKETYTFTITRAGSTGGNGGGGGSSSGDSATTSPGWTVSISKQPDMPTVATITITGTVAADDSLSFLVTDAMMKDAIEKAQAEAGRLGKTADGIVVEIKATNTSGAGSLTANFDAPALGRMNTVGMSVSVNSSIFRFTLDDKAVEAIKMQTPGTVTFTVAPVTLLSEEAIAAIGSRPVFDFTVKDDTGKAITDYGSGTITRGIKYTAALDENTGSLFIVKIVDGKVQWIDQSSYDNGWMVWSGNSNSIYGVGRKTSAPDDTDTANHWAKDAVKAIRQISLLSGNSDNLFAPRGIVTRAEASRILHRFVDLALGTATDGYPVEEDGVVEE